MVKIKHLPNHLRRVGFRPKMYREHYLGYAVGPYPIDGSKHHDRAVFLQMLEPRLQPLPTWARMYVMKHFVPRGVHAPPGEEEWDYCPITQAAGWCRGCTHVFFVIPLKEDKHGARSRTHTAVHGDVGMEVS